METSTTPDVNPLWSSPLSWLHLTGWPSTCPWPNPKCPLPSPSETTPLSLSLKNDKPDSSSSPSFVGQQRVPSLVAAPTIPENASFGSGNHFFNNIHYGVVLDPLLHLKSLPANPLVAKTLLGVSHSRRPRGEKKAIPEELKDDKYFERRKRNNMAAKKSRDCRKAREEEIALRALFLEKENSILRAQVLTLREEAHALRQLLLQKRTNRVC